MDTKTDPVQMISSLCNNAIRRKMNDYLSDKSAIWKKLHQSEMNYRIESINKEYSKIEDHLKQYITEYLPKYDREHREKLEQYEAELAKNNSPENKAAAEAQYKKELDEYNYRLKLTEMYGEEERIEQILKIEADYAAAVDIYNNDAAAIEDEYNRQCDVIEQQRQQVISDKEEASGLLDRSYSENIIPISLNNARTVYQRGKWAFFKLYYTTKIRA